VGTLKSDHFAKLGPDLDQATANKLEDCANGVPSQVQSHFSTQRNSRGAAITRLQQALKQIAEKDKTLVLGSFTVNGVYDAAFAKAVERYKTARDIRNHSNLIDNVVGVKTIAAIDRELGTGAAPEPKAGPKADLVMRLEGNRAVGPLDGRGVLRSASLRQVYERVNGFSDQVLFNSNTNRFLFLAGHTLHDTGTVAEGFFNKLVLIAEGFTRQLNVSIDRTYFFGSSAGGRAVLDLAPRVKAKFGKLTMIGVADGHFTAEDTTTEPQGEASILGNIDEPTNTPVFGGFSSTPTTDPSNRFNWFQRLGNRGKERGGRRFFTSPLDGEIHGSLTGFIDFDLTSAMSRQAASDPQRAHDECCSKGLAAMEEKIVLDLLKA